MYLRGQEGIRPIAVDYAHDRSLKSSLESELNADDALRLVRQLPVFSTNDTYEARAKKANIFLQSLKDALSQDCYAAKGMSVEFLYTRAGVGACVEVPVLLNGRESHEGAPNQGIVKLENNSPIGHEAASVTCHLLQFWLARSDPVANTLILDPSVFDKVVSLGPEKARNMVKPYQNIKTLQVYYPGLKETKDIKQILIVVNQGHFHWIMANYIPPGAGVEARVFFYDSMSPAGNPEVIAKLKKHVPQVIKLIMPSLPRWWESIRFVKIKNGPKQRNSMDCLLFSLGFGVTFGVNLRANVPKEVPSWGQAEVKKWRGSLNASHVFGPDNILPPPFLNDCLKGNHPGKA